MQRLSRFVSFILVILSYLVSLATRRAIHWGGPAAISFEPTNRCNLRCRECPTGTNSLTRPAGMADPDLFRSVIDMLGGTLTYLTLYFQGEPLLHRNFAGMVSYARTKNIYVATSTNGHFMDETTAMALVQSGLNRLIVSVDGADQETYERYREGGDLARVVQAVRLLMQARNEAKTSMPKVILQCLYLKSNEHQLKAIAALGRELGVDRVSFKKAQFYDFAQGHELMPDKDRHRRYRKLPGGMDGYQLKNPRLNSCFRMWSSCVVTWDGKVLPCCFDKDGEWVMGDLTKQSFSEIWNGEKYREFRKMILRNRKGIAMCNNCTSVI